jgi:hypothetical protein
MDGGRIEAFVFIYGPSCVGLLVLVMTCLFAKKVSSIVLACVAAALLHLVSALFIMALVGMGEAWSGQGEAHSFPALYAVIGFAVLAVPPVIRTIYMAMRVAKTDG